MTSGKYECLHFDSDASDSPAFARSRNQYEMSSLLTQHITVRADLIDSAQVHRASESWKQLFSLGK